MLIVARILSPQPRFRKVTEETGHHVAVAEEGGEGTPAPVKVKIKVKGSGQDCPLHTITPRCLRRLGAPGFASVFWTPAGAEEGPGRPTEYFQLTISDRPLRFDPTTSFARKT